MHAVAALSGRDVAAARVASLTLRADGRRGVPTASLGIVAATIERAQIEHPPEESPRQGQVGDDDCRRGLSNVPKRPGRAVRFAEAVVLVEDG